MGTLNISASINDTTNGVNQSANKTVTTTGEGIDQRVLSVGTTEEEVTIATGIGELAAAALHLCVEHKELADRVRAVRHLIQQRKEPEVQWDDLLTEMDKVVMADLEKDNQQST